MDEPRIIEAELQIPARRVAWAIVQLTWRGATSPFRWIAGHLTSLVLRAYIHYCVQSNSRAKCPACGIRAEHGVRWGESVGALVHVCKRCFAVWTEQPMVDASKWRTTLVADELGEGTSNEDGTRTTTIQHAQREPQVVRDIKPTGKDQPVVFRFQQPGGQA